MVEGQPFEINEIKRTPEELGRLLDAATYEMESYIDLGYSMAGLSQTDWDRDTVGSRAEAMTAVVETLKFILGQPTPDDSLAQLAELLEKGRGRFDQAHNDSISRQKQKDLER